MLSGNEIWEISKRIEQSRHWMQWYAVEIKEKIAGDINNKTQKRSKCKVSIDFQNAD